MLRRFLAQHPTFGTKNKPKSLSYQQQSPYYWWWAYLKRNKDYLSCCEKGGKGKLAKLYADFGDVRGEDFKTWWTEKGRGPDLFAENRGVMTLTKLNNKSEWLEEWSTEQVIVIAVPLTTSKRYLQTRFNRLLAKVHTSKRGRTAKKLERSNSKYPLAQNYTMDNLIKTLAVYDLYMETRNQIPKIKLWEIGERLRVVEKAMTKGLTDKHDIMIRRNVMAASVKRYVNQAEKMIANTALGKFPVK